MYFVAYSKIDNSLLAVSENLIVPASNDVHVITRNGNFPALDEVEWNPANLFFYKNGDVLI